MWLSCCDILLSDYYFLFHIVGPELRWRASFFASEDAVEVAYVVISAVEADLGYRLAALNEVAAGVSEPYVDDIVAEGLARVLLEEAAERARTDASHIGAVLQFHLVHIVFFYIFYDLRHAFVVVLLLVACVALGGELAVAAVCGELVEYADEFQGHVATVGSLAQIDKVFVDIHYRSHIEHYSLACVGQHTAYRLERIGAQQAVDGVVYGVELYRYLKDVLALAFVLPPCVFQRGAGYEHKVVVADYLGAISNYA